MKPNQENKMRQIRIEKLTLNVGAGKDAVKLKKGIKLLKNITGLDPLTTYTQKRIPAWGLRPGLPIGCKITLRKDKALQLLPKLLDAKSLQLKKDNFDNCGNISFGIHEYIDITGLGYDPEIGVLGLQVCLTLARPGYRVKSRRLRKSTIGPQHIIKQDEAISFMGSAFRVKVGEEE